MKQIHPASITGKDSGFAAGGSVLDHAFGQSDAYTLGVEEEEVDVPEDGKERVRQVVGDVGRERAKGGGASQGQELLLQGGSLLIR